MARLILRCVSVKTPGSRRLSRRPDAADAVGALTFLAGAYIVNRAGVSWPDIARLVLAYGLTVLGPGLVITRRFTALTRVGRWSVAFTTGLAAQLLGWAVGVATGQTWLVLATPLAFAALWEVIFRRFDPLSDDVPAAPLPRTRWWAIGALLVSSAVAVRSLAVSLWRITPLDHHLRWYQDMEWHVAISAAAMNQVPPTDPQSAAEGMLSYHWFSNAHGAALSLAGGVDVDAVSVVVWFIPVALATLGLAYEMGLALSRSALVAALAPVLIAVPPVALFSKAINTGATTALLWASPSHVFSLPLCLLLTWVVIVILRAPRVPVPLAGLGLLLALMGPGTKVSILPTLMGGLGVVTLHAIWRRRGVVRPVVLGAVGGAVVVGTAPLFAGGGGGSIFLLGATARQLQPWRALQRAGREPGFDVLALFVVALLATYAVVLLVGAIDDVVARAMFIGMFLVAVAAMFALAHPSLSQIYFMRGMQPVRAVFIAWGFVALFNGARRRSGTWPTVILMAIAGAGAFALGTVWLRTDLYRHLAPLRMSRIAPIAVVLLALAVVGIVLLARRTRHPRAAFTLAALVLGYSLAAPGLSAAHTMSPKRAPVAKPANPPRNTSPLTQDELAAGRALAEANPDGTLVATNVHCLAVVTVDHCDARGFWVSAISRSPVDIGAWGYSSSARTRNGVGGYRYMRQPYYDTKAFAQNERAFSAPNRQVLDALAARGVRYLYADSRASRVSPELADLTTTIFSSPTVSVYELRPPSKAASSAS